LAAQPVDDREDGRVVAQRQHRAVPVSGGDQRTAKIETDGAPRTVAFRDRHPSNAVPDIGEGRFSGVELTIDGHVVVAEYEIPCKLLGKGFKPAVGRRDASCPQDVQFHLDSPRQGARYR
jgi:hypothetical protein